MRTLVWMLGLAGCDLPDGIDLPDAPTADRMGSRSFVGARHRATRIRTCRVTSSTSDWGDWTWVYVLDRKGQPIEATTRAEDGSPLRMRWEREYDADGTVVRVERVSSHVRDGIEAVSAVNVFTYVQGRLATYGTDHGVQSAYEWDSERRLTFWESVDDRWTGTWDADGHLVREEYVGMGWYESETTWTWEGDRLVGVLQHSRDSGGWSITWDRWDGDLPAHGTIERWDWEGHRDERVWEETWTWDGGLPTLYTQTIDGAETVVGAWTWDEDRLLEGTSHGSRSVWTWDAEGRAESLETHLGYRTEWTWDGDRITEVEHSANGTWRSERYGAGCPVEARWRYLPGGRGAAAALSPLPRVGRQLPEPW